MSRSVTFHGYEWELENLMEPQIHGIDELISGEIIGTTNKVLKIPKKIRIKVLYEADQHRASASDRFDLAGISETR